MDTIDKINYYLAKNGMSGADLERKIGVSNSVYSQWNTRTTKPSKKSLIKVAEALCVPLEDLFPDNEKSPAKNKGEAENAIDEKLIEIIKSFDLETKKAWLQIMENGKF